MTITTDHPASQYGVPVILDDRDQPMDHAPGVQAVRRRLGLSVDQLADAAGKSRWAIHQYEQGRRRVPAEVLLVLAGLLGQKKSG